MAWVFRGTGKPFRRSRSDCKRCQSKLCVKAVAACAQSAPALSRSETVGKACIWRWLGHWTAPVFRSTSPPPPCFAPPASPDFCAHGRHASLTSVKTATLAADVCVRTALEAAVTVQSAGRVQSSGRVLVAYAWWLFSTVVRRLLLAIHPVLLVLLRCGNFVLHSVPINSAVQAKARVVPCMLSPFIKLVPARACFDKLPGASGIDARCELI